MIAPKPPAPRESASDLPPLDDARTRAAALLEAAVQAGDVPGGAILIATAHETGPVAAFGRRWRGGPPATADTRWDLASLTKALATLGVVLRLERDGRVELDASLGEAFPNAGWFRSPSLADRTPRDLLTHTAGLPAWRPFMGLASTRRTVIGHALASEAPHPHGTVVYSDLGFIVLGALAELRAGARLDRIVHDDLAPALGIDPAELGYRPLDGVAPGATLPIPADGADDPLAAPYAATEACGWRGRTLLGEVHDEAAWIMDGVAGHAGLFGTAAAVADLARAWLRRDPALGRPEALDAAVRRATAPGQPARGLGWVLAADADEPAPVPGGPRGGPPDARGPRGFGHTGFTGTSVWIDPDAGRACVLLTNRVHPTRLEGSAARIAELRRRVHRATFGPTRSGEDAA